MDGSHRRGGVNEVITPFVDYVTSTFVNDLTAKYPREIWSEADNVKDGERSVKTNNHLESFHGRMKNTFGRHPNIFLFVQHLAVPK